MGREIKFRKYKKGDEIELTKIYNEIFPKTMSLKYWNWKYLKNPFGFKISVALNEENEIVGQYCNSFKKGIYFKKEYDFVNVFDVGVKKQYRGGFMGKILKGQHHNKPFLSLSFPSELPFHYGFKHKAVEGAISINILRKKFSFFNRKNKNIEIVEVNSSFKKEIDDLWNKKKQELDISVIRDWKFIKWRILSCPNKMKLFLLKLNNRTIGYFSIFKKGKIIYITDILVINNYINKEIILSIDNICRKYGKEIRIMIHDDILKKAFLKSRYKTFNKKWLSYNDRISKKKISNVYITFLDSDVF